MIIVGGRLFGKVDQVPGLFHVATEFFHVNFVPLVPTRSWLVMQGTEKSGLGGNSWRGIRLRSIRWGSVGMAWLRLGLVVAAAAFGFASLAAFLKGTSLATSVGTTLLAVGAAAALVASYRVARASAESLRRLAVQASMPEELLHRAMAVLQNRKGASDLVR